VFPILYYSNIPIFPMQKTCTNCSTTFEITKEDLDFYDKVSPEFNGKKYQIPPPTHCPDCRNQRRRAQRNERRLYTRKCDLTGKKIVSYYEKQWSSPVYDHDAWWSDQWDGLVYGREFDFSKSFFDQYHSLRNEAPRMGMMLTQSENSSYSAYCAYTRGCYMCTSCVENEDSYHCYQTNDSRNCMDCSRVTKGELCYECIDCIGLFNCTFCRNCETGNDLFFCDECRGCSNCIGCKNLHNKQYQILNQPVSEEEFESLRESLQNYKERKEFELKANNFFLTLPYRAVHLINCENSSGDHLKDCRNAHQCFDACNLEDCSYVYFIPMGANDCHDIQYSPGAELCYDSMSVVNDYACSFGLHSWDCRHSFYVDECFYSENLFGCVGLKNKEYCILNKQYSKEEYNKLVPKIIDHMQGTNEWGEYLPIKHSLFAYNESTANEQFKLTKEQVVARSWKWKDEIEEMPQVEKIVPADRLPNSIDQIPDDILNWAVKCEISGRPFRIVKQELDLYRRLKIPVPHAHQNERYNRRSGLRNNHKLWARKCAKCTKQIQTTYTPDRPETVYCEECYLKEVY